LLCGPKLFQGYVDTVFVIHLAIMDISKVFSRQQQIHHKRNHVANMYDRLSIEQSGDQPKQTCQGKNGPSHQRLTGGVLAASEIQLGNESISGSSAQ
jgi:hypothetical protein